MVRGERFNSISHIVGAALALAALVWLLVMAGLRGDPWRVVSFGVYGVALLLLFLFSALYHALRGRAKNVLRKLDHCAIYLLIAGSYTPFALVTLRGAWGWSLFGVTWALALLGIAQELWLARGARVGSLVIYLLMGWSALVAVVPLLAALTPAGLAGLLAGGLCYTAGIYFYVHDERLRHGHGIWHLFVLAGAICHFLTVAIFVA